MRKRMRSVVFGCCVGLVAMQSGFALAATNEEARIQELERQMQVLVGELKNRQGNIEALSRQVANLEGKIAENSKAGSGLDSVQDKEEIKTLVAQAMADQQKESPLSKFSFGGYGEIHANFNEGSVNGQSKDQIDIHRLVALVGYDFADWIKFKSEIELEHAFVDDGTKGELELEQAYVDFLLSDLANVRVGRVLTPVGRTNQHHEPTTFYSVERPNFDKYIVPSTWWSDGVGLFGNLAPNLSYEGYLVAGLDGSKFSNDGIRNGRIKDVPSLNDMAVTFRLDYSPFMDSASAWGRNLRLGASFYRGGVNNGVEGKDPGKSGDLTIYAADFGVRVSDLELKGAAAFEEIDGAQGLTAGVAEEIFGYYLEAGYHVMPEAWKTGKLKNSDAVVFARYDKQDTQYGMPAGVAASPDKDRYDWTFGLAFYPVPNLVLKADYQVLESEGADPDNAINLGIGWQF